MVHASLKQSLQWKEISKVGKSAAKDSMGVEIMTENDISNSQIVVSNRFDVIAEGSGEEPNEKKNKERKV